MAPTIAQIMAGIEARLATIPGLRVSDIAPDQINPPMAIVGVPPIQDYHAAMGRGTVMIEPTVTVLVSAAIDRVGQTALAAYADPSGSSSVVSAIEADSTLGGIAEDCAVTGFRPLGLEEVGAIGYYGGVFTVRVITTGV